MGVTVPKILHVITGLGKGGAEVSLYNLLSSLNRGQFDFRVVSLSSEGPLAESIRELGVPVISLGMKASTPDLRLLLRLAGVVRREQPDLVQTWLYHADLMGTIASKLGGSPPIVWTIHHSPASLKEFKPATRWVVRLNARLSKFLPTAIICVAQDARRRHIRIGYEASKIQVISNGFDLKVFQPNPDARITVRHELDLKEGVVLIGLCARFHPHKDHLNFVHAAAILHRQIPTVHFLLWGDQVDGQNQVLSDWLCEHGLQDVIHLLGHREDSPRLIASLDLFTLSSASEAFPIVVGEAMSTGVPCVVTDVGDAAWMVGETGKVVPPRDPEALAAAWREILLLPSAGRQQLGMQARQRVEQYFDREKMASQYAQLYRDIIAEKKSLDV